jgi:hypothetical protein
MVYGAPTKLAMTNVFEATKSSYKWSVTYTHSVTSKTKVRDLLSMSLPMTAVKSRL